MHKRSVMASRGWQHWRWRVGGLLLLLVWPCLGHGAVPSAFQEVRYDLAVTYDTAAHTLAGTVTCQAVWQGAEPLTAVYFFLPPNTLSRRDPREPAVYSDLRYPKGFDPARLTVQRVHHGASQALPFDLLDDAAVPVGRVPDRALLRIALPRPYAPGERLDLTIAFTTRLPQAKNWGHYRGVVAVDGLWYPTLVPYRQGAWIWGLREFVHAQYTLRLTTAAAQQAVASVPWEQQTRQQGQQTFTGSAGPLYHLGLSLSARWQRVDDHASAPELHVAVLPDDASDVPHLLHTLRSVLSFYHQQLGLSLSTPSFAVVVHERDLTWPYTASADNLLFVSRDLLRVPWLVHKLLDYFVARGIAQQWWGRRTASHLHTERWIEEGLATFMALEWLDHAYGRGRTFLTWQGAWLPNFSYREQNIELPYRRLAVNDLDQPMTTPLDASPSLPELRIIYDKKAARVYAMLRDLLGTEPFLDFLHRLAAARHLTTEDVRRTAEAVSGQDLAWFFQQWVTERAQLDYAVGKTDTVQQTDAQGRTVYVNRVEVRRLGTAVMPLAVRLVAADGSVYDTQVRGAAPSQVITWQSSAPLSDVQLDPAQRLPDVQRLNNDLRVHYAVRPLIDFPRLDRYLLYPFVTVENNFIDGYIPRLHLTALYLDDQSASVSFGYKENPRELSIEGRLVRNRLFHPAVSASLSFSDRLSAQTLALETSLTVTESHQQTRIPANLLTLGYHVTFLERLTELNEEPVPENFAPATGRMHSVVLRYRRDTRIPAPVGAPPEVLAEPLSYGYVLRLEAEVAAELLGSTRPDFQQVRWEGSEYLRLWHQTSLQLRVFGGWSAGSVPLQRKLSLAGIDAVRGYNYSLRFLGDRMLGGTVSLRFPVLRDVRLEPPGDFPGRYFGIRSLHLAPFMDAGWIWDRDERLADTRMRASAGMRLVTEFAFGSLLRFEVALDVAHPIDARGLSREQGIQAWIRVQSVAGGGAR